MGLIHCLDQPLVLLLALKKKKQKTCQCLSKWRKKPLPRGGSLVGSLVREPSERGGGREQGRWEDVWKKGNVSKATGKKRRREETHKIVNKIHLGKVKFHKIFVCGTEPSGRTAKCLRKCKVEWWKCEKIWQKKRREQRFWGSTSQERWEDIQISKKKKIETVSRNFNQIGWICTTHLQFVPWICSLSVYLVLVRGGGRTLFF